MVMSHNDNGNVASAGSSDLNRVLIFALKRFPSLKSLKEVAEFVYNEILISVEQKDLKLYLLNEKSQIFNLWEIREKRAYQLQKNSVDYSKMELMQDTAKDGRNVFLIKNNKNSILGAIDFQNESGLLDHERSFLEELSECLGVHLENLRDIEDLSQQEKQKQHILNIVNEIYKEIELGSLLPKIMKSITEILDATQIGRAHV